MILSTIDRLILESQRVILLDIVRFRLDHAEAKIQLEKIEKALERDIILSKSPPAQLRKILIQYR